MSAGEVHLAALVFLALGEGERLSGALDHPAGPVSLGYWAGAKAASSQTRIATLTAALLSEYIPC